MAHETVKKFIKDHKGEEITKQEGNFSSLVWGTSCLLIYSPIIKKYFKGNFGPILLLLGRKKGIGFFNFERYKESTKQALGKYLKNKKNFTEIDDFKKNEEEVNKIYKSSSPQSLKQIKTKDLRRLILNSFELTRELQVITLFSEVLDEQIIKEYFNEIKSKFKTDFKKLLQISQLIDFQSFITTRNECLINLNKENIYKNQWIFSSYLYTPALKNCEKLIKNTLKELGGIKNLERDNKKLQKEISDNKLKGKEFKRTLSGKMKDLFGFVKIAIYIRDFRKETTYKLITILSNSTREMFSRLGYPQEDVIYTIYRDFVTGYYKRKDFREELTKRKKGFIVYFGEKGEKIEYVNFNKAKEELYKAIFKVREDIKEIKGTVANKGIVRGIVKVVLSARDFAKFNNGEVLVTSMTRPEFVPLVKKSIAVVTDEGGITCHAAIVSRELNRPCIIGTKIATKFFRDGNLVEVDANKGILRLIKY